MFFFSLKKEKIYIYIFFLVFDYKYVETFSFFFLVFDYKDLETFSINLLFINQYQFGFLK